MHIKNGLTAGFVGAAVLAVIFVIKAMMGITPQLDIIVMLSAMMGAPLVMGWVVHFVIGTFLWGVLFAVANGLIPGSTQTIKGIVLGLFAWLLMMIAVMPMAGAGLFGLNFGLIGLLMPLALHVVFGAVLGFVAAFLEQGAPRPA